MEKLQDLADGLTEEEISNLLFDAADDAGSFFHFYAAVKGFNLRKHDQRRIRSGEIVMHKWVCSRQGFIPLSCGGYDGTEKRRRGTSRIGCEVLFKINKTDGSNWEVTRTVIKHNHECIPSTQVCFMKGNRFLTVGNMMAIEGMISSGIRKCDIMRYFAQISGGNARVGFTRGDLYNYCSAQRSKLTNTSDFDACISYLTAKKDVDPGMTLTTYVSDGVITRCYWADSRSQLDYMCFGDVLAIDSTFKTNAYNYMMILLVGVNHHHQTVVFGSALMQSETTDDYIWFLSNHSAAMSGKMPISIVSDSDKAIRAAISKCWPHVKHRLCLWHLQRNMHRHAKCKEVLRNLNEFVYDDDCVDTMEMKWTEFITSYHLQDNKWYRDLYDSRHMWWGSYMKGIFWAELRSTQRCEGMHSYMKRFVKTSHKLHEFLHHFDRAVTDLRHIELLADYQNGQRKPLSITVLKNFEEHAAEVFTHQSFRRVQRHLHLEALHYIRSSVSSSVDNTYDIAEYDKPGKVTKVFSIIGTGNMTCSCLHFETHGFPCSHIMHVVKVEGYREIPETLILQRWTKKAKNGVSVQGTLLSRCGQGIEDTRRGALVAACASMCYLGSLSDKAYEIVSTMIADTTRSVQSMSLGSDEPHEMQHGTSKKRRLSKLPSRIAYSVFCYAEDIGSMEGPVGNVSESLLDEGMSSC